MDAKPRGNPNWVKGISGNPKGKPPHARALTAILEAEGNRVIRDADGARVAKKRLISKLMWELVTTSQVHFPNGTMMECGYAGWMDAVRWIFSQVDGPLKQTIDLGGTQNPIRIEHGIDEAILSDPEANRLTHDLLFCLVGDSMRSSLSIEPAKVEISETSTITK